MTSTNYFPTTGVELRYLLVASDYHRSLAFYCNVLEATVLRQISDVLCLLSFGGSELENVKQLVGHNKGETLKRIMEKLHYLGYHADYRVFNALKFGVPQKRERVFIVGFREPTAFS